MEEAGGSAMPKFFSNIGGTDTAVLFRTSRTGSSGSRKRPSMPGETNFSFSTCGLRPNDGGMPHDF